MVKLARHVYSCLFGTFLCNSERDRETEQIRENTYSIWSFLRDGNKLFRNYLYNPAEDEEEEQHGGGGGGVDGTTTTTTTTTATDTRETGKDEASKESNNDKVDANLVNSMGAGGEGKSTPEGV